MYSIGIIGYGGMGRYHSEQIRSLPDFIVGGAYDINPERIKVAMEDGVKGHDSFESLLADKSIDAILVATPNNFHKELSIKAMRAGKPVICEKPVMMNTAELEDVLAVSRETGMQFSVHQNRRWDKDYKIVRECVELDLLGTPYYIESRVQGAKGIPGDWRCVKAAGGGMLLDWGVHLLDQILWMTDSAVTEVYAQMLSIKFPEVDDNFKVLLRFANGLSALVEVDTYTFIPLPRWHVTGDKGTMVIDDFDCHGKVVRARDSVINWEEGIVYTAAGPTRTMAPRPKETVEEMPLPDLTTDARNYYINFRDASQGKAELVVKPHEALRIMKLIDTIFASAEQHKSITVNI